MRPYLLQHLLELSAAKHPSKLAVKHKNHEITYEELCLRSAALGYYLKNNLTLHRGDRVGIFLDKSIEQVISILGTLFADCTFVLINVILREEQIKHILQDCQVKLLITSSDLLNRLTDVNNETQIEHIFLTEDLTQHIESFLGKIPTNVHISDDISSIIYTSGSSGLPKGVVITHRNLIDGAEIVSKYLQIGVEERILGLLPFNFDYGFNQLACTLHKGCSLVLFKYLMPNSLLNILHEEKITGLAAIPTIWASVFDEKISQIQEWHDFSNLRYITNSGGKLPAPIVQRIRNTFPHTKLYLMYGLTEAFRSTYLDPDEIDRRPDSIGKAIPNVQVEVIDAKGEICQPGQVGELIHRGACIARGYWNDPQKTAEVFKPNPLLPTPNRFLETVVYSGDFVKKDDEGFLYFIGRKDAMIKVSGYRVSPTEVEELLISLDQVTEAVAFGLEDSVNGQKIRAMVKVSREADVGTIYDGCKRNAPFYLVPHEIYVARNFPKTASGKIDRPKVIEESIRNYGE